MSARNAIAFVVGTRFTTIPPPNGRLIMRSDGTGLEVPYAYILKKGDASIVASARVATNPFPTSWG
jgi:hypothetical protein